MLFGIRFYSNKRGLNVANRCLQTFGSAILPEGKCKIFFTNPFVALKVKNYLCSKNKKLTYKIYILNAVQEDLIDKKLIFESFEDYVQITEQRKKELIEKLSNIDNGLIR